MASIPFALQWTVQEDRLLPLKDSVGHILSTKVTNIPSFEYYLSIYPNGSTDKDRGNTALHLHLTLKNVKKVDVDYTFTIETANYSQTLYYRYDKTWGRGIIICKTDEFFDPEKKYIVNGKFTVKVNGTFKLGDDIPATIADQQQKWNGGELGDEFWKNDETKDFTIVTDGDKEIKVLKLILGMRSDVFNAMFKSNMKEAEENKMVITDFSFNVVEAGIKLIYICNFTSSLSLDELMSLLQFFDKYQLPALKAKVEPFLIAQISSSTVCRLTNASILTNSSTLKDRCVEFLMDSFASKIPLNDIKILGKDVLLEIVESSFIQIVETEP